ncbi:hypothetical protein O9G_005697, partial [Rozella allomycis CSF55]
MLRENESLRETCEGSSTLKKKLAAGLKIPADLVFLTECVNVVLNTMEREEGISNLKGTPYRSRKKAKRIAVSKESGQDDATVPSEMRSNAGIEVSQESESESAEEFTETAMEHHTNIINSIASPSNLEPQKEDVIEAPSNQAENKNACTNEECLWGTNNFAKEATTDCHCDFIVSNLRSQAGRIEFNLLPEYVHKVKQQHSLFKSAADTNCLVASRAIPMINNYMLSALQIFYSVLPNKDFESISFKSAYEMALHIRNLISGDSSALSAERETVKHYHDIRCMDCGDIPDGRDCDCGVDSICTCEGFPEENCSAEILFGCNCIDKDAKIQSRVKALADLKDSDIYVSVKRLEEENFKFRKLAVECRDEVLNKEKEMNDILDIFKSLLPPQEYDSFSNDFEIALFLAGSIEQKYYGDEPSAIDEFTMNLTIEKTAKLYDQYAQLTEQAEYNKLHQDIEQMAPIPFISKSQRESMDVELLDKQQWIENWKFPHLEYEYVKTSTSKNLEASYKSLVTNEDNTVEISPHEQEYSQLQSTAYKSPEEIAVNKLEHEFEFLPDSHDSSVEKPAEEFDANNFDSSAKGCNFCKVEKTVRIEESKPDKTDYPQPEANEDRNDVQQGVQSTVNVEMETENDDELEMSKALFLKKSVDMKIEDEVEKESNFDSQSQDNGAGDEALSKKDQLAIMKLS